MAAWSRGTPGDVGEFKVVKDMPRMDEALELLKKLHSLCKPIQKKYGWYLPTLTEFFPSNPGLLGMNRNHGEVIYIRLRPADDRNSFIPLEESLVGTLLHEFTHNVHGPHHKQFYEFLDKLQDEYDVLRTGGYSGEGFLSDGKRTGTSHNLPPHLARAKALQEAEKRQRIAKVMGPAGGSRLGAAKPLPGKTPRQMAADAAERRARDAKSCGHGEAVSDASVEAEMGKASAQATTLAGSSSMQAGSSKSGSDKTSSVESEAPSDDSDIELISDGLPLPLKRPGTFNQSTLANRGPNSAPPYKRTGPNPETNPLRATRGFTWICHACTFENEKMHALACELCATERLRGPDKAVESRIKPPPSTGVMWTCHLCGGETEHQWWTCRMCGHMKQSSSVAKGRSKAVQ